jgi:uncharacterized C2H2 Zn-finger protein
MERYTASPTTKYCYQNDFLVECPCCGKAAEVRKQKDYSAVLNCSACFLQKSTTETLKYNATVKVNCVECGAGINHEASNFNEKQDELLTQCENCGVRKYYRCNNTAYNVFYENKNLPADLYFNLPLWFRIDIKGETLWAYNRAHLCDIQEYVSAKLRERQILGFTTMVEKLPLFIISAKNRAIVLRKINTLLTK